MSMQSINQFQESVTWQEDSKKTMQLSRLLPPH